MAGGGKGIKGIINFEYRITNVEVRMTTFQVILMKQ